MYNFLIILWFSVWPILSLWRTEVQWQWKVVEMMQNIVSYAFLWIRWTYDYIKLDAYYWVLFSSRIRVRIRFSVWPVSGCAHLLLSVVIVLYPLWRYVVCSTVGIRGGRCDVLLLILVVMLMPFVLNHCCLWPLTVLSENLTVSLW